MDHDRQICDPVWASKAIQEWLSTGGNVRTQHSATNYPAGVGVKAWTDQNGATYVKSLIVEPVAQKLVRKGALRAYSVGIAYPSIKPDPNAPGGRIYGGKIAELSLVDRPSNSNCGITIAKSINGSAVYIGSAYDKKSLKAELKKQLKETKAKKEAFLQQFLISDNPADREMARELLKNG